jgi:hypothetical protein
MRQTLKEKNEATIKRALLESAPVKAERDYFMKRFGEDPIGDTEKWNFVEGKVDLKALKEKLREADLSSTFSQFLRAGIQQITNSWYQTTPVTYTEWVNTVQSSLQTELYTPNHGLAFPQQVGEGELYPEVGVAAMDISLRNWKFGTMFPVSKELMNDDKSGSMQTQIGRLGEYMAILTEVLCYAKLASASNMSYLNYTIPTSETKPNYEANWPYAAASAPFVGGGFNRPASYAVLTQAAIQAGMIALAGQKNLQGIRMLVNPSHLLVSWKYKYDLSVLLNSAFYPSGAAAAGTTGGAFAVNPIQGILQPVFSRYMFTNAGVSDSNSGAWYIADAGKGFIQQLLEPVSVEQEAPNSGESFARDVLRFKASTRQNADYIDPRFFWRGSDGSI